MPKFQDSLRGYSFPIHKRDNFVCVYCGLDGKKWPNWFYLTSDHLLPRGHARRENRYWIVTACTFCNVLCNRTRFDVAGKTRNQLIEQKKVCICKRRNDYRNFWQKKIKRRKKRR